MAPKQKAKDKRPEGDGDESQGTPSQDPPTEQQPGEGSTEEQEETASFAVNTKAVRAYFSNLNIPFDVIRSFDADFITEQGYELGRLPKTVLSTRLTSWIVKIIITYDFYIFSGLANVVLYDFKGRTEEIWKKAELRTVRFFFMLFKK